MCARLKQPTWVSKTYAETKRNIVGYTRAKEAFYTFIAGQKGAGHWMRKPREEKLFH